MATALSLLLLAWAVTVWATQFRSLRNLLIQIHRVEEIEALQSLIESEVRIAGHRATAGPSTDHDELRWSGPSHGALLHYLCDGCRQGTGDSTRTLRLQDQVLQHRSATTGGHQALHDSHLTALARWTLDQGTTSDCQRWARVTLNWAHPGLEPRSVWMRARNLGLLDCERRD